MAGRHGAHLALDRDYGSVVGSGLPHHLLHRRARRGRHDDRHGGPAVDLPAAGLTTSMAQQAIPRDVTLTRQGWFERNRSAIVRHGVINLFNLIIILPLAWVLMMSVKSLPDAMRGDFWPRTFDFTHYSYVFEHIVTLPVNLFNSIYVTAGTV